MHATPASYMATYSIWMTDCDSLAATALPIHSAPLDPRLFCPNLEEE